jgi:uncharacterized damage-inducible protein DinB
MNNRFNSRRDRHLPKTGAGTIVLVMFRTVEDFLETWKAESDSTLRLFNALSDDGLSYSVVPGGYTLGSLAGHIAGSIAAIPAHAGLVPMPAKTELATVEAILAAYKRNAKQLADAVVEKWNDAQLGEEIPLFGRSFRKGAVLAIVISHQAHHRAQMTVLMRQAGLKVPGMYGPSQDDLAAMAVKK